MQRILIVEDELKIGRLVRDYLENAGFDVTVVADGHSALSHIRQHRPDLVVLDLGIPGIDGLDVTRTLRRTSETPIVMLTARAEESDRIVGLELGADDYVTKPFSPKELVARVRAVLRRTHRPGPAHVVRAAGLTIDVDRRSVESEEGTTQDLTATEFEILVALARDPGRVLSRSQIVDQLQGIAYESRSVDAHIKNIRKKIEPDPSNPTRLLTVYGVGYKLSDA
ncbi:MAG: response regulator transcription factor [Acidimicrobiia bacterium]|nr:response regulator transcription factor [Acidimicrobiia bacterium]